MRKKLSTFFVLALIFQASVVCASEFIELSLKELMQIDVVSAFKTPQPLRRVAAAMHVISAEDIRRSGATSIPQVLRLVPGLQVLDSAITAGPFQFEAVPENTLTNSRFSLTVEAFILPPFPGFYGKLLTCLLRTSSV